MCKTTKTMLRIIPAYSVATLVTLAGYNSTVIGKHQNQNFPPFFLSKKL